MDASAGGDDRVRQAAAKTALRDQMRAGRARRPLEAIAQFAGDVAEVALGWDVLRRAATVAVYVSVGSEPGTGLLLERLVADNKRVIVPVVLGDLDLDWVLYTGRDTLAPAVRGLLEPTGPRLGVEAVGLADVVLVPGLAVSTSGERLGQGGGCYDRALARVAPGTPVAVMLYDDEVGQAVPTAPHDLPVGFALTSSGVAPLHRSPDIR